MKSRPEEISSIIKQQIKTYKSRVEMKETGTVILVGDGIAKVLICCLIMLLISSGLDFMP